MTFILHSRQIVSSMGAARSAWPSHRTERNFWWRIATLGKADKSGSLRIMTLPRSYEERPRHNVFSLFIIFLCCYWLIDILKCLCVRMCVCKLIFSYFAMMVVQYVYRYWRLVRFSIISCQTLNISDGCIALYYSSSWSKALTCCYT